MIEYLTNPDHLIAWRTFTKFSFVPFVAEAFSTNAFPSLIAYLGRITFNALLYIIHRWSFVAIAYFAYRSIQMLKGIKRNFHFWRKKRKRIKISYRTNQSRIGISHIRSFRVRNKNFQYFYNCNRTKVQYQLLFLMLQNPMHPRL